MENPMKMDDLGVPPFKETPILCVPGTGCSSPPTHRLVTRKKIQPAVSRNFLSLVTDRHSVR